MYVVTRKLGSRLRRWVVGLIALAPLSLAAAHRTPPVVPLVLMSIDGLRPDYVLEADRYGLRIPELRRLLCEGAHAQGVRGVLPTITYPSHTTLVTGVSPARHGILANRPFDPLGQNSDGWFWYAEDIRAETLWDAAADAGLTTASVDWPVTVGARIRWNVPQVWRAGTADDGKLSRAVSTAGLLHEVERAVGPWPAGEAWKVEDDRRKAAFSVYLLETKKPDLHLCYFSSLDEAQHATGPGSPQALAALEEIDQLIGWLRSAAEKRSRGPVHIAVVSDHGFAFSDRYLEINESLHKAGFYQTDARGHVTSWRAFAWNAGGCAAIMLKDPGDQEARREVAALLRRLRADPRSGIEAVMTGAEARAAGGFPEAAFVVGGRAYALGTPRIEPAAYAPGSTLHGEHGYLPGNPDMDASFFVTGPGILAGRDLGHVDMRDVAPTLAGLLRLSLPAAEGRDLFDRADSSRPRYARDWRIREWAAPLN
jgi:predicted AlkP superfamily pyrophosphatase or phosphodiesterase